MATRNDFARLCLLLVAVLAGCLCSSPAHAGWGSRWRSQPSYPQPQFVEHMIVEQPAREVATTPVQYTSPLDRQMDGARGYNSDRVSDLPQGEEKLYLTLTVSDGWKSNDREKALVNWFDTDPRLLRLRSQMHWNSYTPSNPHWNGRLRKSYGDAVPMVTIQNKSGQLLMHLTAPSIPRTSGELADMADNSLSARYAPPRFNSGQTLIVSDCPDDSCTPPVQPNTEPFVGPVMPDVVPWSPHQKTAVGFVGLLLVVIVGGLAALAYFSGGSNKSGKVFN